MSRKNVAVIGGGIAGLSAAWLLRNHYDIVLFERNDYLGGHSNTLLVETRHGSLGVDTGFVVFNHRNYPLLTRLFRWLDAKTQPADMTFAASIDHGAIEYAGSNLNTLFGQRRNLVSLRFWYMVGDIVRFGRAGKRYLESDDIGKITTGEFLDRQGFGYGFRNHYLLPMAAAIWSCPVTTMMEFPAKSLLRFFDNHGLLDLSGRPQWQTVVGGSREYVKRIECDLATAARIRQPVESVQRNASSVRVRVQGGNEEHFDEVVFATHADTTLKLLDNPTQREQSLLSRFRYQTNETILHSDTSLMPVNRRVWSSWNYLAETRRRQTHSVSVTYWMNHLQRLDSEQQYFVSLNPLREPKGHKILAELSYDHPVFDTAAIEAQAHLPSIQGVDRLWFTGSYLGYGFHEDALRSSVRVAGQLGAEVPWSTEQPRHGLAPPPHVPDEVLGTG